MIAAGSAPAGGLWRRGHRPFFLAAAVLAAAFVPLWLLLRGGLAPAPAGLDPLLWHGHEMLLGYVLAVLSGFLLLAQSGRWVAVLLALWAAGRVVPLAGLPEAAAAGLHLAYPPALALLRRPPLWRRAKWPMAGLPVLLAALAAVEMLFHAEALGLGTGHPRLALYIAADLFTVMAVVVGGRLIAGYTRAAGIAVDRPRRPWLEGLLVAALLGLVAGDLLALPPLAGVAALAAAALLSGRLAGWRSRETLGQPLLWVLHLGIAWIVTGLALRAAAGLAGAPAPATALHAVAIGGFGSLTLGMMSRLVRSHARAPLAVGHAGRGAFVLVSLAALARIAGPPAGPPWSEPALVLAGGLWTAAFLLFLWEHGPVLLGGGASRGDKSR